MIKSLFGITQDPFSRDKFILLPQQERTYDIIKAQSQHGGLSVITGDPGVGKTALKEFIETSAQENDSIVSSFSRTMQTYSSILRQLCESMQLETSQKKMEKDIIHTAFKFARERKTIFTLIDEAHLIDMETLRKLRLLFDQFPKKHNLILFGQRELMYHLSKQMNHDLKSRITYSINLKPLNDQDLENFIKSELEKVGLGIHVFSEAAIEVILRNVCGNLRLCCNLCYGSLLDAAQNGNKTVSTDHVNSILIQPHWREHDELIKQQAS